MPAVEEAEADEFPTDGVSEHCAALQECTGWDRMGDGANLSSGGMRLGPFSAGSDSTGGRSKERAGGSGKTQEAL